MTEQSPAPAKPSSRRFQFSLGAMLLWVAIVCLAISNAMTLREIFELKRELTAQRPLPAQEVARQFRENTTLGPISVSVGDVRYSSKADSYKVEYSWTDANTGKTWSSDIELMPDGYGAYYGVIRNGPFVTPLGVKNGFTVAVKTPSPLGN